MSIDFETSVTREFSVASLVESTIRHVHQLVGPDVAGDFASRFFPYRESGTPAVTDRLHSWIIGAGRPEASLELTQEPNVVVTIYSDAVDDDWMDAYVGSTADYRTASSVVVAIAAVLAANELGAGVFTEPVAALGERQVEERIDLLDLLRREPGSHADLESASREVLRKTAAFGTWTVVTEGIGDDPPRSAPTGP